MNECISECDCLRSENLQGLVELHHLRGQKCEIECVKSLAERRHNDGEKWRMDCNKLENENKQLKQQIVELHSKNTILYDEIQNFKHKYSDLDQERLKQVESNRVLFHPLDARFDSDNQRIIEIEEARFTYEKQVRDLENNLLIVQEDYERLKAHLEEHRNRESEVDERSKGIEQQIQSQR